MTAARTAIKAWHDYMGGTRDGAGLRAMIAAQAIFHSPVVHYPQQGADKVFAYLHAASQVLGNDAFRYVRELYDGDQALLEFETVIDGVHINGIDLIRFDDHGHIIDFKVMVRPLKAINKVWEVMAAQLETNAAPLS